jgi:hypothetical protein
VMVLGQFPACPSGKCILENRKSMGIEKWEVWWEVECLEFAVEEWSWASGLSFVCGMLRCDTVISLGGGVWGRNCE